jgi:acetylglutamate kinase
MNYSDQMESLIKLLPYLQAMKDKKIVIKYGGAAMKDKTLTIKVIEDIVFLASLGLSIIVVHGGGPIINNWLQKVNIEPSFTNGIRITDPTTMEIVQMVLAGKVNKDLVNSINQHSVKAVGLCGKDANLIVAEPCEISPSNRVANVRSVNVGLINILVQHKYIPIIAPVASDSFGNAYNINADTVAGEIAASLKAFSLVILTDTAGILKNHNDPSSLLPNLNLKEIDHLIDNGTINGGMLPKVNCCTQALLNGVESTRIIDGRVQHSLLLSLLTNQEVGSTIIK